jgi:hypothetical protein
MYGKILSCGCLGKERRMDSLYKHHQSKTRLYFVYRNILNRCYNKNVRSYADYGANGVKVCPEWRYNFAAFSRWAFANGYDPDAPYGKCTIDRIDVYGDYRPDNCRWVTMAVQCTNRRQKPNKTGFPGVVLLPNGRYQAVITVKGKRKSIGVYETAEEAGEAYRKAKEGSGNA